MGPCAGRGWALPAAVDSRRWHRRRRWQRARRAAPCPTQEEQIDLLKESDDSKLLVEIYMSELARVRYLLRAYLRTRLQKIERHVMHVLDNAGGHVQAAT